MFADVPDHFKKGCASCDFLRANASYHETRRIELSREYVEMTLRAENTSCHAPRNPPYVRLASSAAASIKSGVVEPSVNVP
jgi:hypothetical protein